MSTDPLSHDISEKNAGLVKAGLPALTHEEVLAISQDLPAHLSRFLNWFSHHKPKTAEEMYCFILYDIEHNKIRRIVAKFLEKKGCIRIQKSVFFARMSRKLYQEVREIMKELQQCYDNQDSIVMLPVGEDMLNKVSCVGRNFDFELMTQNKNTLIF